jgi:hypothetical protein
MVRLVDRLLGIKDVIDTGVDMAVSIRPGGKAAVTIFNETNERQSSVVVETPSRVTGLLY